MSYNLFMAGTCYAVCLLSIISYMVSRLRKKPKQVDKKNFLPIGSIRTTCKRMVNVDAIMDIPVEQSLIRVNQYLDTRTNFHLGDKDFIRFRSLIETNVKFWYQQSRYQYLNKSK